MYIMNWSADGLLEPKHVCQRCINEYIYIYIYIVFDWINYFITHVYMCHYALKQGFFEKSRSHLKMLRAKGWHETCSILRAQNIRCYRTKCSRRGNLAPGICAPLLSSSFSQVVLWGYLGFYVLQIRGPQENSIEIRMKLII